MAKKNQTYFSTSKWCDILSAEDAHLVNANKELEKQILKLKKDFYLIQETINKLPEEEKEIIVAYFKNKNSLLALQDLQLLIVHNNYKEEILKYIDNLQEIKSLYDNFYVFINEYIKEE